MPKSQQIVSFADLRAAGDDFFSSILFEEPLPDELPDDPDEPPEPDTPGKSPIRKRLDPTLMQL